MVLFSAAITLVTTGIQIYLDYNQELRAIDGRFEEIHNSNLIAISQAVWVLDDLQVKAQLSGLLNKPEIKYVEVRLDGKAKWAAGSPQVAYQVGVEYPLKFDHRGQERSIGQLTIKATLADVYRRLINKVLVILFSNLVKTFLVAGFLLIVFHRLVTRHLLTLSNFARQVGRNVDVAPVELQRRTISSGPPDELDDVVTAMNEMKVGLQETYDRLKESDAYQHLLLDSTHLGMFGLDAEGRSTFANEACRDFLGYEADHQIIGLGLIEFMPHEHGGGMLCAGENCALLHALATGSRIHQDNDVIRRRDGASFEAEYWAYPVHGNGHLVGLVVTFLDISERKRAEEALHESEERFRVLANANPFPILVCRQSDQLHMFHNGSAELFFRGFQSNDAAIPIEFPQEVRVELFQELMKVGQVRNFEASIADYSGSNRSVILVAEYLTFEGEPALLVGIQDVTDLKIAEKVKNDFISTLSHELRTPMTSIKGSLGLISGLHSQSLSENVNSLLEISQRNCDSMINLINDLLDIQKISSGKLDLTLRPTNLGAVLQDAIEAIQGYAETYGVKIAFKNGNGEMNAMADQALLHQVIANLLSNAIKYSPKDEKVEVSIVEKQNAFQVRVKDYGEGIPEKFHPHIFGRFSQADSSDTKSKAGTGLGLSISWAYMNAMGGKIGFTTKISRGTTFHIELPRAPE